MKIYVASSWKNEQQPSVVEFLRAQGHEVYDFRHPEPDDDGFSWKQVGLVRDERGKSTLGELKAAHAHPTAAHGFKLDFDAMKWADACVVVLPCGNSAHLEAGWMRGQGKPVYVYADEAAFIEPELMYMFLDGMHDSLRGVAAALHPRHYPAGMGDESRRLHREYNALAKAQEAGAKNGADVRRLTDECAAKGIILVTGGERL